MQIKLYGESHRDIAMNLNHLGVIHYIENDISRAISNFQDAVRMKLACLADDHPDLIAPLHNLISAKLTACDTTDLNYYADLLSKSVTANPNLADSKTRETLLRVTKTINASQ